MEKYLDEAELLSDLEVPIYSALSTGSGTAAFPGDSLQVEVQKASAILEVPGNKGIIHRIEDDPIFRGTIHSLFSGKNQADLEELYASSRRYLDSKNYLISN